MKVWQKTVQEASLPPAIYTEEINNSEPGL